jgi:DNA-binding response OmpR family regulator
VTFDEWSVTPILALRSCPVAVEVARKLTDVNAPILVIDDDEAILEFVSMALTDEGYEVITAPDGAVGLELAREFNPALVVLDMRMPVLDGYGFLNEFCADSHAATPIIAVSAHQKGSEPILCADLFMAKPFNVDDFIAQVKRFLPQ